MCCFNSGSVKSVDYNGAVVMYAFDSDGRLFVHASGTFRALQVEASNVVPSKAAKFGDGVHGEAVLVKLDTCGNTYFVEPSVLYAWGKDQGEKAEHMPQANLAELFRRRSKSMSGLDGLVAVIYGAEVEDDAESILSMMGDIPEPQVESVSEQVVPDFGTARVSRQDELIHVLESCKNPERDDERAELVTKGLMMVAQAVGISENDIVFRIVRLFIMAESTNRYMDVSFKDWMAAWQPLNAALDKLDDDAYASHLDDARRLAAIWSCGRDGEPEKSMFLYRLVQNCFEKL